LSRWKYKDRDFLGLTKGFYEQKAADIKEKRLLIKKVLYSRIVLFLIIFSIEKK
jgi:hypothetical protein